MIQSQLLIPDIRARSRHYAFDRKELIPTEPSAVDSK